MIELVNKRQLNKKIFLNPDGSMTAQCHARPIHYLDDNDEMKDLAEFPLINQEIEADRNYNLKKILVKPEIDPVTGKWTGGGTFKNQAHVGHIHYRNTAGVMTDVDYTLEDMGAYWQMTKASYKLFIAKDFGADRLIVFRNRYRGANHEIVYEPKMLAWVNNTDLSDFQVFRNQQSVQGYVTGEGNNVIRYDNAFGDGIHFEITLLRSGFKKEIVIQAKNKLELPPTANHKLVALFKYDGQGLKVKSDDKLREWNKTDYFEELAGFRIQEDANEVYQSFIRPAYIIDSSEIGGKAENIKVFWKLHNGSLYQAKVLPTQFLKDAVYPVRADTTTSYYGAAGDGTVQKTGTVWSTVRDATDGTFARYDSTTQEYLFYIYNWLNGATRYINRGFLPFDTSALDDSASISAVNLKVYVSDRDSSGNGQTVQIVAGTQADTASLSTADYDQIGSTSFGSANVADSSVGSYFTIALNASGIAAINKTGYTKLAARAGSDLNNSQPGYNQPDQISYRPSEYTGTGYDPYLEITYNQYTVGAGDGRVYVNSSGTSAANWDTAHDATTGTGYFTDSATDYVGIQVDGSVYRFHRAFLPFDTTTIPAGATITAAVLNVYWSDIYDSDNDGYDYITVVQTDQASTSTLSAADYNNCGATNNPTEAVDTGGRIDLTGQSAGWKTYTFNATGRGFIVPGGWTKLGMRSGHDVQDHQHATTGLTMVGYKSAETAGLAEDPFLAITYTEGGGSTFKPRIIII